MDPDPYPGGPKTYGSYIVDEDEDEDFMDESTVNREGCIVSLCRRTRTKISWTSPL
jgi:hypothetical protein